MSTTEVRTQEELDAAIAAGAEEIHIFGGSQFDRLIVLGSGSSHVVARGSSHVVAWESSHVEARESSHVEAWGSSHVVAWGSSHVVASGSSHVVARGSSHVEARGSSHVVARGSSHVEAWGSSHVEAWGEVTVNVQSEYADVLLFGFAVAVSIMAAKIRKRSKTSTIIRAHRDGGNKGWIERNGIRVARGTTILFKRVSREWKTQEGTANETGWAVGLTLVHHAWNPAASECGPGQFHACSRPYFCDEFRSTPGDRYVAIRVKVDDLKATDNGAYPHKIAFRAGKVLYECDRYGNKLEVQP